MRKRQANGRCCLPWLLLLLLAACRPQAWWPLGSGGTQAISAVEAPAATETKSPPVAASPSLQVTVIHPVPSLSAVQTPTIPSCDPQSGYCLYPYLPHLQPPLLPEHWIPPAATYRYGQTQNGQRAPHHGLIFLFLLALRSWPPRKGRSSSPVPIKSPVLPLGRISTAT